MRKKAESGVARLRWTSWLLWGACCALLLAAVPLAIAQNGTDYDLSWWTVDGGGYISSEGGGYSLGGSIGQGDAGPAHKGSGYTLIGGFWPGAVSGEGSQQIYLPIILRDW